MITLTNLDLEESKDAFDYEVNADFENLRVNCFVDVETSQEEQQQTNEEIESQGVRFNTIVDAVSFWLVEYFDENDVRIFLSNKQENEVKHEIENKITNQLQND